MKRCVVPVLALIVALTRTAEAEPPAAPDSAAAQALFYKARALMQQGRYAEACAKLEESVHLDAGVGARFNLADCNEHLGKIASAWTGFVDVADAAKAAKQPERENVARKRAQALESRVPKLVIDASAAPSGLEVTRDGVAIDAAMLGTELPVDPGLHHIKATAPGKLSWETDVHVGEARTMHVVVPRDLVAPAAAALPPQPDPFASGTTTGTPAPDRASDQASFPQPVVERSTSPQKIAGWALVGAGVVAVGVGAGFGLASIGAHNSSEEHCAGDVCDSDGVRLRDDAIRNGSIATFSMIGGGTALAGGLILVLTAPRRTETTRRPSALRAVPSFASTGGGVLLEGSFR